MLEVEVRFDISGPMERRIRLTGEVVGYRVDCRASKDEFDHALRELTDDQWVYAYTESRVFSFHSGLLEAQLILTYLQNKK